MEEQLMTKHYVHLLLVILLVPTCVSAQGGQSVLKITGVNNGQSLKKIVNIEAIVTSTEVDSVNFQLEGSKLIWHTESVKPFFFMGDVNGVPRGWDTRLFPDGDYKLNVTAIGKNGPIAFQSIRLYITNSNMFVDSFDRIELGPDWNSSLWTIKNGEAYNYERGYSTLQTSVGIPQRKFILESQAKGFGPTQGPSPADSVNLVFCRADLSKNNYYRVSYFPSPGSLLLQKIADDPLSGEIKITTLARTERKLGNDSYYSLKVSRDGASGLVQVFIGSELLLQTVDRSYPELGHFGWILESQAPGDFFVNWIKARW
jgi:hypothetical protein